MKITGPNYVYQFLYDSQNKRIGIGTGPNESSLIWRKIIHQANLPIGELDSTNGVARWFVRGIGIAEGTGDVIAEIDNSGDPHYYLSNHRGDTLVVLNDSGTEECQLQYDSFGNIVTNTGTFSPAYKFSTKEYLENAELYLYEYRLYGPLSGRWTQRDPIDYQDSVNLYQFCGNNPVIIIDEWGLKRVVIAIGEPHSGYRGAHFLFDALPSWVLAKRANSSFKKFSNAGWDVDFLSKPTKGLLKVMLEQSDVEAFIYYGHASIDGYMILRKFENIDIDAMKFSDIPKNLSLLVLDSCYSGDFNLVEKLKPDNFIGHKGTALPVWNKAQSNKIDPAIDKVLQSDGKADSK